MGYVCTIWVLGYLNVLALATTVVVFNLLWSGSRCGFDVVLMCYCAKSAATSSCVELSMENFVPFGCTSSQGSRRSEI